MEQRLKSIFSNIGTENIESTTISSIISGAKRLFRTNQVKAQWFISKRDRKKFIRFNLIHGKNRDILFSTHKMLSQIVTCNISSSPWFEEVQSRFDIEFNEEILKIRLKMEEAEKRLLSDQGMAKSSDQLLKEIEEEEESKFKESLYGIFKQAIERNRSFDQVKEIWDNLYIENVHSN